MSRAVSSRRLAALAAVVVGAPLHAQRTAPDADDSWLARLTVTPRLATFDPSGHSELFSLVDRALTPGSARLRPALAGIDVRERVTARWSVVGGIEAGRSTVASTSRVQPASSTSAVQQRTSLDLTTMASLGAQWSAYRWRRADGADRLRVALSAGGGVARYRLRQWGDFVDADRLVAYSDDYRSAGQGAFAYVGAGVEVPVARWVALQGDVRRLAGSAPMSADYATFDRLDLGGTRVGAGLALTPGRRVRR